MKELRCEVCDGFIPAARVRDAASRGQVAKYCGIECRVKAANRRRKSTK